MNLDHIVVLRIGDPSLTMFRCHVVAHREQQSLYEMIVLPHSDGALTISVKPFSPTEISASEMFSSPLRPSADRT